ncbi:hypothetical protein K8Z49_32515 [Actinomadura madurae]|uniref:hypothetical protein n=1 Tax=Actinomadura madurae TaxID=1993 RepID=UPI00399BCEC3
MDRVDATSIERGLMESPEFVAGCDLGIVDLTATKQFDVVALLYLLSLLSGRRGTDRRIRFKLPADARARHLLRRSCFAAAAELAAQTPFPVLVDSADLAYFGEHPPLDLLRSETGQTPRGSVLSYLIEQHHFGLSAHRIDGPQSLLRMLDEEVRHWGGYAMVNLLDGILFGQAIDVSRVVVQELVANVVEHPKPSTAVVASQLELRAAGSQGPHAALTIAAWDDGLSIVETLRTCLRQGDSVRAWSPDVPDTFAVRAPHVSGGTATYASSWTPGTSATDEEILLASLFPGITRKAAHERPASDRTPAAKRMDYGYGLFALYKAAVDHFRGSVELRCGATVLSLTRPDRTEPYQVTLSTQHGLEPLTGTIVTVRLPVRDD